MTAPSSCAVFPLIIQAPTLITNYIGMIHIRRISYCIKYISLILVYVLCVHGRSRSTIASYKSTSSIITRTSSFSTIPTTSTPTCTSTKPTSSSASPPLSTSTLSTTLRHSSSSTPSTTSTTPIASSTNNNHFCYDYQDINGTLMEWDNYVNDKKQYYYSTPLCIDEKGRYVLRECRHGKFIDPKPQCYKLQPIDYNCLEGLDLFRLNSGAFCYIKSKESMRFEQEFSCPYKQVDANDNLDFYAALSNVFPLWMPYHRKDPPGGVGYFVPDLFYGEVYSPWVVANTTEELRTFKCLSMDNEMLSGDCQKEAHHVCVYRAISLNSVHEQSVAFSREATFCQRTYKSDEYCRMSWRRNSLNCICPVPNGECYAAVAYPTGNFNCRLGMKFNESESLVWTSPPSNESSTEEMPVQNTLWSHNALQNDLKEFIVLSDDGWTTTKEVGLNCTMCEMTFESEEFEIFLEYDPQMKKAYLNISDYSRVFNALDPSNFSYVEKCYMEGSKDVWRFEDISIPGIWQCEVIDVKDTNKIFSNTVQMDFGKYVYIIQLLADGDSQNILHLHPILDKIFQNCCSLKLLFWQIVSDKADTWIEEVYRMGITLPGDEDYYALFKALHYYTKGTFLEYLKVKVYNTHFCAGFTSIQNGHRLRWPEAKVDQESFTSCYDKQNRTLGVKCVGSFTLGARFSDVPECYSFGNTTDQLSDLENSDDPPEEVLGDLNNILQENSNFTTEDFNITANILEKFQENGTVYSIINVISSVMAIDPGALQLSQRDVNVTDRVLYSLDVSLKQTRINSTDEMHSSKNIECLIMDRTTSDIAGIAYLLTGANVPLKNGLPLENILQITDLESAAYINRSGTNGIASLTMFKSSVLFNEQRQIDYSPFQRVFGVLVPEDRDHLKVEVVIIFPGENLNNCAYWKYGNDSSGTWEVNTDSLLIHNFTVCFYNHTTHYGQLIMLRTPLDPISDQILSTMTAIESALSALSLLAILFTAIIFPSWRRKKSRVIHYCLVLLVQTILLFVNTNIELYTSECIIAGALLHFTVLSQFCWMLVIAVHHHQTLVIVYQTKQTFWESRWVMLFTYGIPLLIVIITICVDITGYIQGGFDGFNICYPCGDVFLYSLLVPTTMIASVNACIFLWIFYKLLFSSPAMPGSWLSRNLDKIRTLALMIFTLGITWWFGFAALLFDNAALLYLFTITTGMQGFIIFVVHIVARKEVWAMYSRKYKLWILHGK